MTQARASHLRLVVNQPAPVAPRRPNLRFRPVVDLSSGETFGLQAEADISFEDTFRPRHLTDAVLPTAAGWLGDMIERLGVLAAAEGPRPIALTAPMAALADADGPMAAEAGAKRANLLPQEVRIDFCDASIMALEDLALDRVDAYRRRGFRVGLDARMGWRTAMGSRARMTFEAVRLAPNRCEALEIPLSRLELASAEGVALIADGVTWRDAEALAGIGVRYAVAPRADG